MLENMNFYNFMHKQICILIVLFVTTGPGFIYISWIYGLPLLPELVWYFFLLLVSLWGYSLHRTYRKNDMTLQSKEKWLQQLNIFLFIYFSMWTLMFVIYTSQDKIELHYVVIAAQLGTVVVSAAILASQRKLAIVTLLSLMLPLTIYFILVDTFYGYLIAFFTLVLSWVLLHASGNTYKYLLKSQHQAYHDHLTSLGNRRFFIKLLENAIKLQQQDRRHIYLLLIDLDHFKTINDSLGHDIGDILLREVSSRMLALANKHENTVSRLGGDEFCVLSSSYASKQECLQSALAFSQNLLDAIKESYTIDGHHLYISASIGVSIINNPNLQAGEFVKEADIAMYEAKSQGRDGIILFNEELSKKVERTLEIERFLHFALEKNEISLRYQPQINAHNKVVGCEVLVRWHHEKLGHVGPDEFIPISEQTGLIIELGYFILEESLKTLRSWEERGIELEQMSINISMRQLFHGNFVDDVQSLCKKHLPEGLHSKLVFEITETIVAEDIHKLISKMNTLKACGIRFSMDDFGTGYSSLSYLRQIPIDELKIDKSFVGELGNVEQGENMVRTILHIAKNLRLNIVAEGVETAFQKEFLLKNKCDILQGYHFSKPIEKDEFEKFFINYTAAARQMEAHARVDLLFNI
jgi:diguanylate cyclase (GGDEF)-like protein